MARKSSSSDSTVDHEHVAVSLSFVLALNKPEKVPQFYETVRDGQHKRIYENLPHTHHFHLSYQLLPPQENQAAKIFKTDMVVFGEVVSKIYTDIDTRVVQGYPDDGEKSDNNNSAPDLNKYCWKHRHKFKVNKSFLLDIHRHVLEIHLWTTPNKLSTRARYDRPKAFRLPSVSDPNLESPGGMELSKRPSRFPDVSHDQQLRNARGRSTRGKQQWEIPMEVSLQSVQSIDNYVSPADEKNCAILEAESSEIAQKSSEVPQQHASHQHLQTRSPSPRVSKPNPMRQQRLMAAEEAERARIDREGVLVFKINMSELFSKQGTASARMESPVEELKKFEVYVSAGKSLPTHILRDLKPMTVTVERISNLPDTPLSHRQLKERCEPVYAQYQFPSQPLYRTPSLPHASSLTFGSCNVILLGTISQNVLLELLRGPPLTIEVHDRDNKLELASSSQALFGIESQDNVIGTHAFSSDLPHLVGNSKAKSIYPYIYGVATFDLSLLLSGQLLMEFTLPVIKGPRCPSELESPNRSEQILPGDYLDSGCEITVKIELSYPLAFLSIPATLPLSTEKTPKHTSKWRRHVRKSLAPSDSNPLFPLPFSRLVYVVSSQGRSFVQKLLTKINEINARTLNLDSLSPKVLQAALSTYKLTQEQLSSKQCDIITGFHVEDTDQHIVMLEGLKDGGVKTLWEELPRHSSQDEALRKVFYNSDFGFSQRLYGTLDVDLPRIRLFRPLKEIVQIPLIYLQGYIPYPSYRSLMCLKELELANKMADLTKNQLFPTAEEVAALSLQFGIPVSAGTQSPVLPAGDEEDIIPHRPVAPSTKPRTKRVWLYLDDSNPEYEEVLRERKKKRDDVMGKDFIRSNITQCGALSELTRLHHPMRHTHYRSYSEQPNLPVYNYSCQARNSTQHTLARLREELQPNRRYTFCHEFLSGALEIGQSDAEAKSTSSAKQWMQREKFVYPGTSSARESNLHPKRPDSARVKEISEPYDKKLGVSRLRSTLDRFTEEGKLNFDLLKPPPEDMFGSLPASVHPVGDEWEEEQEAKKRKEKQSWRDKIIVDDIHFHTHRRGIGTELSNKAADRLDALQGMLKDQPKKLSLQNNSTIPPLGVVHNSSIEQSVQFLSVGGDDREKEERCTGYQPGPYSNRSLRNSVNIIPISRKQDDSISKPFRLYYHTHKSLCHYPNMPRPSEVPGSPPVPLVCIKKPSQHGQQQDQPPEQAPAY